MLLSKPSSLCHSVPSVLALLLANACAAPGDNKGEGSTDTGPNGADDGNDGGEPTPCTTADPDPGLNAEGHPADGWNWERRGLLWQDFAPFEATKGEFAPSIVEWNGEYLLLFTRAEGASQGLFVTRSTDMQAWSTPEPLSGIESWQSNRAGLIVHDGQLRLYHSDNPIVWSLSNDGVNFEYQGEVIHPGPEGGFDDHTVFYPNPVEESGSLALYYSGLDGDSISIGRTQSDDGGSTWAVGQQVLGPGVDGWDQYRVAMSSVQYLGEERLMWFSGYDTPPGSQGVWRIGLHRGDRRGVTLPHTASVTEFWGPREPTVVGFDGGWLMIYSAMGEDSVYRLHYATSRVCNAPS